MSDELFHHKLSMPVSERDHAQGADSAPITLVLYGDYICPFTANLHLAITRLQRKFGENFRYVFRHFPLFTKHAYAQLTAEAAEAAAAQGRFWDMHAYLFQRQNDLTKDFLQAGCKLLGLDYLRLDRDISGHVHLAHIMEDVESAKHSGVAGTPGLFINGVKYEGSEDYDALSRNLESLVPVKAETKHRVWDFLKK